MLEAASAAAELEPRPSPMRWLIAWPAGKAHWYSGHVQAADEWWREAVDESSVSGHFAMAVSSLAYRAGVAALLGVVTPFCSCSAVPLFIKNMHPPFPVGFDDPAATLNFAGYALTRLPRMPILLFIDRRGTVREQHDGAEPVYFGDQEEQNLRKSIVTLLAPSKPASAKTAPRKTTSAQPRP